MQPAVVGQPIAQPMAQPIAQPTAVAQPMALAQPVMMPQQAMQPQQFMQPQQSMYPQQIMQQPMMQQQMMMQPQQVQMMPMQSAPQIIVQQQPQTIIMGGGPAPINIDRSDPAYLDAADVAGCWLELACVFFPSCTQYDAVAPDEIGGPGYCCLGIMPCCNQPTPIWHRTGPRSFGHPHEGDLNFTSDRTLTLDGSPCAAVKLCGQGPWMCFDPWC